MAKEKSKTPLLDQVRVPSDLQNFSDYELKALADELRQETIKSVSLTGGHLGAGLGVVELTVALHAVFETPKDKIIWDVGHQSYPHKILTNRRAQMKTLRQKNGLSGLLREVKVHTILLEPLTVQHQFRPHWAFLLLEI